MLNKWVIRWRVPLGFLFALAYLFMARNPGAAMGGLCLVLVAAGCGLRSWSAGYLFKGKRLAVGGPYAYIRNPLYIGSFLIGLGFCAALYGYPFNVGAVVFTFIFIGGFWGLYFLKAKSEEGELEKSLGQAFLDYRQRVPAFFPTNGRVSGLGEQRFSIELYRKNREYQCVLGCVAVLAFIFIRSHYGF